MDINVTESDVREAEALLDNLGAWLMDHTTSFGASVIIMQGALSEIDKVKAEFDLD